MQGFFIASVTLKLLRKVLVTFNFTKIIYKNLLKIFVTIWVYFRQAMFKIEHYLSNCERTISYSHEK